MSEDTTTITSDILGFHSFHLFLAFSIAFCNSPLILLIREDTTTITSDILGFHLFHLSLAFLIASDNSPFTFSIKLVTIKIISFILGFQFSQFVFTVSMAFTKLDLIAFPNIANCFPPLTRIGPKNAFNTSIAFCVPLIIGAKFFSELSRYS